MGNGDLEGKWRTWSTSGRPGGNLLVVAIVERPAEALNRGVGSGRLSSVDT